MTDGKPQPCNKGCGQQIYTSDRSGKWLPYNVDDNQKHDCPNYRKKLQNFRNVAEKVEQEISLKPQESAFKPNNAMGKIAELETEFSHQMTEMSKRVSRAEQAIQALVKELSYKKASELPKEDIDEQVIEED